MPCSHSDQRLGVAAVALLCVMQLPNQVLAGLQGHSSEQWAVDALQR